MLRCGSSSPPGRKHSAKPESLRLSGSPGSKPPPDVGKRQKKKRVFFFRRTLDFAPVLDGPDSVLELVVGWGPIKKFCWIKAPDCDVEFSVGRIHFKTILSEIQGVDIIAADPVE